MVCLDPLRKHIDFHLKIRRNVEFNIETNGKIQAWLTFRDPKIIVIYQQRNGNEEVAGIVSRIIRKKRVLQKITKDKTCCHTHKEPE